MDLRSNKKDYLMGVAVYFGFLIPVLIMNCSLKTTEVLDETSNLSIAAYLCGYDWSYANLAIGNYFYKYFQVLFYVPFLKMNIDPYLRYSLMMAFNSVVICLIPVICYFILRRYLKVEQKNSVVCSVAAGSVSAVLLYSQHISSDLFLEVLPWLTVLLMFKSMRSVEDNKRGRTAVFSILAALSSACAYASHARGIVLVIASVMTIIIMRIGWKKKIVNPIFYFLTLITCLIADKALTEYFKANVFPFGVSHNSLSNVDADALAGIVTSFSGFGSFLRICVGWLYTAATSTFGLAVLGSVAAGIIIHHFRKNREDADPNELVLIYMAILNFIGSAASGIIFFYQFATPVFDQPGSGQANLLVYERYMACSFGMLCLTAFLLMIRHKEWFTSKIQLICILSQSAILLLFTLFVAPWTGTGKMPLRHSAAIVRFIELPKPGRIKAVYPDAPEALVKMGIYSILVLCLMFLLSRFGKKIFILLLVFIVFSTENTIYSFIKVRYNRDVVISNSTRKLYDPMASLTGIDDKYKTILCYSSKPIKYIQVLFPDFVCIDYEQRKDLPKENVIYIIGKDRSDKKVSRLFKKKKKWYLVSDIRSDKDVVYVTGKKLASTLRRQGHKLITYTRKKSKAL